MAKLINIDAQIEIDIQRKWNVLNNVIHEENMQDEIITTGLPAGILTILMNRMNQTNAFNYSENINNNIIQWLEQFDIQDRIKLIEEY